VANIRTVRRSGRVFRGGRSRRESLWFDIAETETTITAASTAALFTGLTSVLLGLRPFTIVRTRGTMMVSSDQTANTETQQIGFGICVVSDQALAIGVTAVPTPMTDGESDLWFVFEVLEHRIQVSSAIGILSPAGSRKDWDSRAMRKVEEGSDIALSVETGTISSGLVVTKHGRMLIKLH